MHVFSLRRRASWYPGCILKRLPILPAIALLMPLAAMRAQEPPPRPLLDRFYGTISVTHNGISLVPTFSLGDPALLFDLKFVRGRHSFEPDMRFALEGKPWSFLFWYRYQAVKTEKWSLRLGAHPSVNFRTETIIRDGQEEDLMEARRYFAFEAAPNYALGKHISVGAYYLTAFGFDEGLKRSHFVTLNASFSNLSLGGNLYFAVTPQLYYLRLDEEDGLYVSANLSLGLHGFPLSLGAIINQEIDSEIDSQDFNWNVSLVYSF